MLDKTDLEGYREFLKGLKSARNGLDKLAEARDKFISYPYTTAQRNEHQLVVKDFTNEIVAMTITLGDWISGIEGQIKEADKYHNQLDALRNDLATKDEGFGEER